MTMAKRNKKLYRCLTLKNFEKTSQKKQLDDLDRGLNQNCE